MPSRAGVLLLAVLTMGLVVVSGLASPADDGSVAWPSSFRDTVTSDDGSVTWLSVDYGHASEPTPEAVDPACFRSCMRYCCLSFWYKPWYCLTVCPAFCSLVCSL